jgi:hypothetical protein
MRLVLVFLALTITSCATTAQETASTPQSSMERVGLRTAKEPIPSCEAGHDASLSNGVVTIKPGETICLRLQVQGKSVSPVAVVSTAEKNNTLVLRMWQEGGETFLSLNNPIDAFLRYEASMLLPGQSQYQHTSSCPVLSQRLGIEQWPQAVSALTLKNFESFPDSDRIECR